MIDKIMDVMDTISYGVLQDNMQVNEDSPNWDDVIGNHYALQSPEELLTSKTGVCFDQVELERDLFTKENIEVKTYFICTYDGNDIPSHTFLTYEENEKIYWFEHSWYTYKGVHEYSSEKEMLLDIKNKFRESHSSSDDSLTFVYEYLKPDFGLSCDEFYAYCQKQKLIKLNEPLYFYHVINKDADLTKGILSLKYMHDNNLHDLFLASSEKYLERITNSWRIEKYLGRDKESLTEEEIIDALKIFRGEYGASYIYFFKYPLYEELGAKIKNLLKVKNIYRININDEEVQKSIKDIFYGYDLSNSDNKKLDKKYYETVSEKEYFAKYDDNLLMNFSTLNHISIAFINDYCPIEFLEKVS